MVGRRESPLKALFIRVVDGAKIKWRCKLCLDADDAEARKPHCDNPTRFGTSWACWQT